MSATNRGSDRRPADFYETPEWCTEIVMPHVRSPIVVDPCAGNGAIMRVARRTHTVSVAEIRQECWNALIMPAVVVSIRDSLANPFEVRGATVVTNPPYSLAQEFVETYVPRYDEVMMLLRLNFLGSQKRLPLWRKHPPARVIALSRRPSFTGSGTDATEYAWFIWRVGERETRLEVV